MLKERILATCEANKLDYVNDPTNFQPQLTIRNSIRHCLDIEEKKKLDSTFVPRYPDEVAAVRKSIKKAAANFPELNICLSGGREHLREVVKKVAKELEEVDATGLSSVIY